jgi:hypothetical protein
MLVTNFCANRLDESKYKEISAKHSRGLCPEDRVEEALKVERHEKALERIWGETNLDRKLSWLKEHSSHAICLYERALAEFDKDPRVETITRICIPLLRTAFVRNGMDLYCNPNEEQERAYCSMASVYIQALDRKTNEKLGLSYNPSSQEKIEIDRNLLALLKDLKNKLPSLQTPLGMVDHTKKLQTNDYGDGVQRVNGELYWNSLRKTYLQLEIGGLERL